MTRQARTADSAGFSVWIEKYRLERYKYPARLEVCIDEPIRENARVIVLVHPAVGARDRLGCFQEPRYQGGYELPICLFKERLNLLLARNLDTALTIIQELQGIENHEALAYMTQVFLIYIDHWRANSGFASILFGPTWKEFDLTKPEEKARAEKAINTPIFRMSMLLRFWNHIGGILSRGFVIAPEGKCGRPNYRAIPPMWLTIDALKEIYGEQYSGLRIPVLVDHKMIPLIQMLPEISTVLNAVMSAPQSDSVAKSPEAERFAALPNLHWEEVNIAFISNDAIKIQARGSSQIFMFSDIGFKDKRKGNFPDTRWEILRDDFAGNEGVVTHGNRKTQAKRHYVKAVQDINARLQKIVGIKEKPIAWNKKERAYKTKFRIKDNIPYPYSPEPKEIE